MDAKPFMLQVIRHSISVHRPRVTGIQAVAAGYLRRIKWTFKVGNNTNLTRGMALECEGDFI
jgi:hypothetical protein